MTMTDRPVLTITDEFAARLQDADDQIEADNIVRLTGMTEADMWAMLNRWNRTDYPMPATFGENDD